MTYEEFVKEYTKIVIRALQCSDKSRREGLLALEDDLDKEKIAARDIFEYGMILAVDGADANFIDKILSNIIKQEKDEYMIVLKTMQKEAVLTIQADINPRCLGFLLNSYTNLPTPSEEILDKAFGSL